MKPRKKQSKAATVFIVGTIVSLLLFSAIVAVYAVSITKKETPERLDAIMLCAASFFSCLITGLTVHKSSKTQKTVSCILQSLISVTIITLLLLAINRFSVSLEIILIPAAGILGGFLSGVLLQTVFTKR